jgi:hypothetical protein
MSGLDPGIHLKKKLHLKTMDGRVKPGHDATEDNPRRTHACFRRADRRVGKLRFAQPMLC